MGFHEFLNSQLREIYCGEFDPGSELTLAVGLKHASRTVKIVLRGRHEWRTGE